MKGGGEVIEFWEGGTLVTSEVLSFRVRVHLDAAQHPAAPNLRPPLRAPSSALCDTDRDGSSSPGRAEPRTSFFCSHRCPLSPYLTLQFFCTPQRHDSPIFFLPRPAKDRRGSPHVWPRLTELTRQNSEFQGGCCVTNAPRKTECRAWKL